MERDEAARAAQQLEDGERSFDADNLGHIFEAASVCGEVVATVLQNEGHDICVEGASRLAAQEVYCAMVDAARAAVLGVVA